MTSFNTFKENIRFLVVDDNEDNRITLTRRLQREGYNYIDTAVDGGDALNSLQATDYDIVFLDLMMPEVNGFEVLQQLDDKIKQGKLSVIVVSAADDTENIVKALNLGADDLLPKPFNKAILQARLDACIMKGWLRFQQQQDANKIQQEKARYQNLIHAVFPANVVNEVVSKQEIRPRKYDNVAVMFVDIVGFTSYCDSHSDSEMMTHLQNTMVQLEKISEKYQVTKIKTIGDAYMAVAGIHEDDSVDAVLRCIQCANDIIALSPSLPEQWQFSIGVAFGSVIGGTMGNKQYAFDIWGDVVNTASRLQDLAGSGQIYLSEAAKKQLGDACHVKALGKFDVKGKSQLKAYRTTASSAYDDTHQAIANSEFS